jgi:hypothetical protein
MEQQDSAGKRWRPMQCNATRGSLEPWIRVLYRTHVGPHGHGIEEVLQKHYAVFFKTP